MIGSKTTFLSVIIRKILVASFCISSIAMHAAYERPVFRPSYVTPAQLYKQGTLKPVEGVAVRQQDSSALARTVSPYSTIRQQLFKPTTLQPGLLAPRRTDLGLGLSSQELTRRYLLEQKLRKDAQQQRDFQQETQEQEQLRLRAKKEAEIARDRVAQAERNLKKAQDAEKNYKEDESHASFRALRGAERSLEKAEENLKEKERLALLEPAVSRYVPAEEREHYIAKEKEKRQEAVESAKRDIEDRRRALTEAQQHRFELESKREEVESNVQQARQRLERARALEQEVSQAPFGSTWEQEMEEKIKQAREERIKEIEQERVKGQQQAKPVDQTPAAQSAGQIPVSPETSTQTASRAPGLERAASQSFPQEREPVSPAVLTLAEQAARDRLAIKKFLEGEKKAQEIVNKGKSWSLSNLVYGKSPERLQEEEEAQRYLDKVAQVKKQLKTADQRSVRLGVNLLDMTVDDLPLAIQEIRSTPSLSGPGWERELNKLKRVYKQKEIEEEEDGDDDWLAVRAEE